MPNRILCGLLVSSLLIGMFSLIPYFVSAIPKATSSPVMADRNLQVWKNGILKNPQYIEVSADGKYIVAGGSDGGTTSEAILLDENNTVIWHFNITDAFHQGVDGPFWVSISDDGGYVAFGGAYSDGTYHLGYAYLFNQQGQIWNKTGFFTGQNAEMLTAQGRLSGDGSRLALNYVQTSFNGDRAVEVYDTGKSSGTPGWFMWRYVTGDVTIWSVDISFAGDYVAIGCDGAVSLLQTPPPGVHEGILVWQDNGDGSFWPIRISADGKHVLTGTFPSLSNTLGWFVCYNQTGKPMWNYTTEWQTAYWEHDLDLSADGQSAVGVENSTIYFFDQSGLKWAYDTNNAQAVKRVVISADGNSVVARDGHLGMWHLNRFGKLIWRIDDQDLFWASDERALAISANGEHFYTAGAPAYVVKYSSRKYFSYRFVTPDLLPISNLNVNWYFSNGTLYSSALTNSSGWTTFFDPHFVDYSTVAYYWGTKVGEYTLVTIGQYESNADQTASLFDWNINIHDVKGSPVTAQVETYLWNGTLYDNRTASSLRFEDLPNQTYTLKAYYPTGILSGQQQIALTKEEQDSTFVIDTQAPTISSVKNTPLSPSPTSTVKISANVTDDLAGVHDVTISYTLNASLPWTNVTMTYDPTSTLYEANIPSQPLGTNVSYLIVAVDNTGKLNVNDNATSLFTYRVVLLATDINGDGIVNIIDVTLVCAAYTSTPGAPNWNVNCDVSKDGIVNIVDVGMICSNFGKKATG